MVVNHEHYGYAPESIDNRYAFRHTLYAARRGRSKARTLVHLGSSFCHILVDYILSADTLACRLLIITILAFFPPFFMRRSAHLLLIGALLLSACGNKQAAAVEQYVTQVQPIIAGFEAQYNQIEASMNAANGPDTAAMQSMSQTLAQTISSLEAVTPEDPVIAEAHKHLIQSPTLLKQASDSVIEAMKDPANVPAEFTATVEAQIQQAEDEMNLFFSTINPILPEELKTELANDEEAAPQAE